MICYIRLDVIVTGWSVEMTNCNQISVSLSKNLPPSFYIKIQEVTINICKLFRCTEVLEIIVVKTDGFYYTYSNQYLMVIFQKKKPHTTIDMFLCFLALESYHFYTKNTTQYCLSDTSLYINHILHEIYITIQTILGQRNDMP